MPTEVQPPYKNIFYDRSGNLSTITRLNQPGADNFMRVADMRRDIRIVDTDRAPDRSAVGVGSDVLAFRVIQPIGKLSEVLVSKNPMHSVVRGMGYFEVQVHERYIDEAIRSKGFVDRDDYNEQFLQALRREVKSGVAGCLTQEKLGFRDQRVNYLAYMGYIGLNLQRLGSIMQSPPEAALLTLAESFMDVTLFVRFGLLIALKRRAMEEGIDLDFRQIPAIRSSWKEGLMPLIPVDTWVRGQINLLRHGMSLVAKKD